MIGLALSGGGSRAIAFHLGCLRALNDLGILDRIGVISTISGGSIIGAYFAYTPDKEFAEFDADVRRFLRQGFQWPAIYELLRPWNLSRCGVSFLLSYGDALTSRIRGAEPTYARSISRTDIFANVLRQNLFQNIRMSSPRRNNINVVIGACEIRSGIAFRFGNEASGDWRHGELIDWDADVGFATAASAAYPLFLPSLDRTWVFRKNGVESEQRVLISDGGLYDNLGVEVLEPYRDHKYSLHVFPCDYLIVCNAGRGQESGTSTPTTFLPRVTRSFEIVHRRVQESAMGRLHYLRKVGAIKGFVMPYLGQQDTALPWEPLDLIPREEVISYPTDFGAMSNEWINKLANRGEQLTRGLVDYYLTDLL